MAPAPPPDVPIPTRTIELRIGPHGEGKRVDTYLPGAIARLSRTRVKAMLGAGEITVDGRAVKPSHKLRTGQLVAVVLPDEDAMKPRLALDHDEAARLVVAHEDEHILAVCKPAGMPTQPRHRFEGGSLVNAVLAYLGGDGTKGPMVMHRLDVDTSGVVLVAKTSHAATVIGRQFNRRTIRKEYRALVHGDVERADDLVQLPLGQDPDDPARVAVDGVDAKPASTRIVRLRRLRDAAGLRYTWLALHPRTGRTHQLRVHTMALGHPMVADDFYGPPPPEGCALRRQALHAHQLTFTHPATGEPASVVAPLPDDLTAELDRMRDVTETSETA